jgi:Signal transduction histidine kinase
VCIDTGIGIVKKDRERIFEPFVALDESRNREKSGFGLGLSIARNLAENNGYELFLDDSYERGCRFVIKKIEFIQ